MKFLFSVDIRTRVVRRPEGDREFNELRMTVGDTKKVFQLSDKTLEDFMDEVPQIISEYNEYDYGDDLQ